MRIARHVSELIGNTPLVQLNSVVPEGAGLVAAKIEYLNPGGSAKDRIAVKMIDAAEASGAVLLFDEADALFGKRSEVKDSHDRYANIEVSYLLQRMEAYRGLAILTSNQKAALDTAFHRRLRFVINFPFPEASEREAIWRGIFPVATPTEGLDHGKLARLQMAGGSIRNIALAAAFLAADDGQVVDMGHLLRATRREYQKMGKIVIDGEFGEYARHVIA
jgi:SpoVK/Ycf46/Vps4 family AAA+-type ATPase